MSEVAPRSLLSMAWLDSVNRERERRGAARLERCLLSAHGDVFRVPWEDLVYPQFTSQPTQKEDQQSTVQDGGCSTSHAPVRDTDPSGQDLQRHPSSAKAKLAAASNEAEDSEGEYVELAEIPLPRFSPQKGSLTLTISQQHRVRSSTCTQKTFHRRSTTPADSSWSRVPDSFGSTEDHLQQDPYGAVILTPVSFSTESQEMTRGTDSPWRPNVRAEPERCTEQRAEEDEEEREEREEEREEEDLRNSQDGRKERIGLVDESLEEDRGGQEEMEITVCETDEMLLPQLLGAEEENQEERDEKGGGAEEVELDEEVRVTVVRQRQACRGVVEQHGVTKGDRRVRCGGGDEEEDYGGCGHASETVAHTEKNAEDFYSEAATLQTHCESRTSLASVGSGSKHQHMEDSSGTSGNHRTDRNASQAGVSITNCTHTCCETVTSSTHCEDRDTPCRTVHGQGTQEKVHECSCEEVGAERTAELQAEGTETLAVVHNPETLSGFSPVMMLSAPSPHFYSCPPPPPPSSLTTSVLTHTHTWGLMY